MKQLQNKNVAFYNISVNSVAPGTVDPPMPPRFFQENSTDPKVALAEFDNIPSRGKIAPIEEVANVFVFLASDESANITATDIRGEGGY